MYNTSTASTSGGSNGSATAKAKAAIVKDDIIRLFDTSDDDDYRIMKAFMARFQDDDHSFDADDRVTKFLDDDEGIPSVNASTPTKLTQRQLTRRTSTSRCKPTSTRNRPSPTTFSIRAHTACQDVLKRAEVQTPCANYPTTSEPHHAFDGIATRPACQCETRKTKHQHNAFKPVHRKGRRFTQLRDVVFNEGGTGEQHTTLATSSDTTACPAALLSLPTTTYHTAWLTPFFSLPLLTARRRAAHGTVYGIRPYVDGYNTV